MAVPEDPVITSNTSRTRPSWVLSIDFGTSSTVAVAAFADGRREVIEFNGERRTPSMVLVDDDGALVVGHAAAHLAASRPDRVIRTPKRRLGDQRPVVLGGRPHQPVDLAAAILRHVATVAYESVGWAPSEVRLTHPATWNRPLQQRLLEAAARAGLPGAILVPEPVAAAMSLGADAVPVGRCLAIYDLGGGTFDTTIVRSTGQGFEVVGDPIGDPSIGGELFDEIMMNLVGARLDAHIWEQLQVSDEPAWRQAAARLLAECQRVKEALSLHAYGEVAIAHPVGMTSERVTRAEFEAAVNEQIEESVRLVQRSVTDAGIASSLAGVRLIGGSSRMPLVARMVRQGFPGLDVADGDDPRTAVALGAALVTPSALALDIAAAPQRTTIEERPQTPTGGARPNLPAPTPAPMSEPPGAPITVAAAPSLPANGRPPAVMALGTVAPTTGGRNGTLDRLLANPVALVGVGVASVLFLAGGVWAVLPKDDATQTSDTTVSTATTVDTGDPITSTTVPVDETVTTPTASVVASPTTTVPTTTSTTSAGARVSDAAFGSVLLTDADMGAEWTQRAYAVEDDPGQFCDLVPAALPIGEVGRVWDHTSGRSFVNVVYDYSDEAAAAAVLAQDKLLAEQCPESTQLIEGVEFDVGVVQPDLDLTGLTQGDETAIAGFVLISGNLDLTLYMYVFEQRWGRTVSQTSVISTAILTDAESTEYLTLTLEAFELQLNLPR